MLMLEWGWRELYESTFSPPPCILQNQDKNKLAVQSYGRETALCFPATSQIKKQGSQLGWYSTGNGYVTVDELDVLLIVQITNGECMSQVTNCASWSEDKIVISRDWYTFCIGSYSKLFRFAGQMVISGTICFIIKRLYSLEVKVGTG